MNIGIISRNADPNSGGWGNITFNICNQLYKKNINFNLFLPSNHNQINCPWKKQIKFILPSLDLNFNITDTAKLSLMNYNVFKDFTIIHSLFSCPYSEVALHIFNKFNIPYIIGAQGTYGVVHFFKKYSKYKYLKILNNAKVLITPSIFTLKSIISHSKIVNLNDKSKIIHNGIDPDILDIDIDNQKKIDFSICGIGSVKERKGFDLSIKAIGEIKNEYPDIQYKIAGTYEKKYFNHLNDMIKFYDLKKNVEFLGNLTRPNIYKLLSKSYLYMHLPININWNFEGFGIVYVEANAFMTPCIGSDSGGVSDAIIHNKTGFLAKENSHYEASLYIKKIFDNKQLYDDLSNNSYLWAKKHSWNIIIKEFIEEYKNINK